jgi:hypothetical protein
LGTIGRFHTANYRSIEVQVVINWDAGVFEMTAIAGFLILSILPAMFFLIGWRLIIEYIKGAIR